MTSPTLGLRTQWKLSPYRDQLDAIMSMFSDLLADNRKDALRSTITSLKKLMVKHWWQMAKADVDVVLQSIHNSNCVYLWQQPHHWRCWCGRASDRCPLRGGPSSGSCPKRYGRWRSRNSSCHASTTFWKCTPICHHSWLTFPHWPRSPTPRPSTWLWRQWLDWWFRSMSQSITWVQSKIHPWRPPQKNACPGWKKSSSPSPHLSHRNHGTDPPGSISNASFSMVAPPRKLALHLRCEPNNWSKLLLGKVYLGGSTGAAKGKCKWSHTVAHEGDVAGDEPPSPSPLSKKWTSLSLAAAVQAVLRWDSFMTTSE